MVRSWGSGIRRSFCTWSQGFGGFAVGLGLALGLSLTWAIPNAWATSIYAIPRVSAGEQTWVVDQADLLSRLTTGELNSKLDNLAQNQAIELRFVTFRRLDYGETIQTFVDKLFAAWFPDDQGDREVLFALDAVTNTGGIHGGAAVADLLPEDLTTSITEETLVAPLRDGDKYNQALGDVADRLIAVLSGDPDPGPPNFGSSFDASRTFATAEETESSNATTIVIVLLIIATVVPMLTYFAYVR